MGSRFLIIRAGAIFCVSSKLFDIRLNTLSKTLNDEKKIAELKDDKNKLVISHDWQGISEINRVWFANGRIVATVN